MRIRNSTNVQNFTYCNKQIISLLSSECNFNVLKHMNPDFTITTKNRSNKFNSLVLMKFSITISMYLTSPKGSSSTTYNLNIDDERNVLGKFEKLYQGESVVFDREDLKTAYLIVEHLNLIDCPNFLKRNIAKSSRLQWSTGRQAIFSYLINGNSLQIDQTTQNFINSICHNSKIPNFTIQTNKFEYKCNFYAVFSSSVIAKYIEENPDLYYFKYDFDDEENEFSAVCSIFNFNSVQLTSDNAEIINEIAQDLGIDCILTVVNKFISDIEKVSKTIDDQEETINSIDDLFYSLYHIKEKTVNSVVNMIEDSKWSQTEENILELASFIIQVIQTKIDLHQYLIDLLIKLDEDSNTMNNGELKGLLPFMVDRLLFLFSENLTKSSYDLIFPFVYKMYKIGVIPKERLEKRLKICQITNSYFVSWFLPELILLNPKLKDSNLYEDELVIKSTDVRLKLYYPCNSNNILNKEYEKIRDSGYSNIELEKALREDDVDTFQSIVSKSKNNILIKEKIRVQNIFEPFINQNTNYLNYAAAYGSIKCFKYMLLNDEKIDESTFELAILGGNNELIRIVDIRTIEDLHYKELSNYKRISTLNALRLSIQNHQNDLFDWILEQKFSFINRSEDLFSLVVHSLSNGNIHSLIQIIDKGFDFNASSHKYFQFLETTSKKGFYLLTKFLINLIKKSKGSVPPISIEFAAYSDNIYMFKLFENSFNNSLLNDAFVFISKSCLMNIMKFFFEKHINKTVQLNSKNTFSILASSIYFDSKEYINYLFDNIMNFYQVNIKLLIEILDRAFDPINYDVIEKVVTIIFKNNSNHDFTEIFSKVARFKLIDVAKFLINKKCQINFDELDNEIASYDLEIFLLILDNIEPELKERFLDCLNKAIVNKNKPLIKYLLSQNVNMDDSLIKAAYSDDFEIFQMILDKKSDPPFINQRSNYETALIVSVRLMNKEIFDKLLSTPGINPSIYDQNYMTPLSLLAQQLNVEQFNSIVKFYGENIKKEKLQLEKSIKVIIEASNYDPKRASQILLQIVSLNCINFNYRTQKSSLLIFACKINSIELVKALIQKDEIDVNLTVSKTGDTPLITAIKINSAEIINLLIEHPKIDLNMMNFEGKTPLQLAVDFHQNNTIKSILNNKKFDAVKSKLNLIFYASNPQTSKIFLTSKFVDVNYVPNEEDIIYYKKGENSIIQTSLIKSIISNDKILFDLICKHPSFNRDQSQITDALNVAFIEKKINFFNPLLDICDKIDINSPIIFGKTPLVAATKEDINEQMINCIITNKSFDSKKSDIVQAFQQVYTQNLINSNSVCLNTMSILFNYDINHDHLIDKKLKEDGGEILSNIYSTKFVQNAFSKNILSSHSNYLKQLIESDQNLFVLCIINSNKAILTESVADNKYKFGSNAKLENNSYLHLAAEFGRTRIIEEILNRHLLDINITNSLGETPLLVACKSQQIECVKFLFKYDDLDFNHKNNKGEDALEIVRNLVKTKTFEKKSQSITNKDEYLSELLKTFDLIKNKLKFMHSDQQSVNKKPPSRPINQSNQKGWSSSVNTQSSWGSGWRKT